jgi:hypothetical protein
MAITCAVFAQVGRESRQHFAVHNGTAKFTVTRIDTTGEQRSSAVVLIRENATGRKYELRSERNYAAQTADYRFVDAASGEYVAAHYKLPLKAVTRSETAAELRAAARTTAVVHMTLATARASEQLDEVSWRTEAKSRDAKRRITGTLSPEFVQTMARLQAVLSVPPLVDFCHELISHLQSGGCGPNKTVRLATLPPDCSFDEAHGVPCSNVQRQRAQAIRKSGTGSRY